MTTNLTRFCPQCDATTTARLCPHDGTVTLMSEPPAVDVDKVAVPGAIIDHRYQLVRLLGKGGFGAVFAAKHTGTGHEVALKILHATDDLAMLKRFFREARVTAALRSRHTIRVIDFGQDDQGVTYLAMELLKGRTVDAWLSQRLRAGEVLSEAEAIEIAIAVCKSLGEAHAAGLVHRDLKPQNLFQADTEDGPVLKVLDFGIVKVHDQSLTGDSIIGTTAYMSPEQALSQKLDGRSDLYSLGAMLYELVGGSVPFSADTPVQVLLMQINAEPEPLKDRAKVPISDEFAQLVMGLLAKHPEQRPADAADLLAQLTALRGKANTATKKTSLRVQGLRGFGEPEEDDATRTAESARAMTAATAASSLRAGPEAGTVALPKRTGTERPLLTAGIPAVSVTLAAEPQDTTDIQPPLPTRRGPPVWAIGAGAVAIAAGAWLALRSPAAPPPPAPAAPASRVVQDAPAEAAVAAAAGPAVVVAAPVTPAVAPASAAAVPAPAAPAESAPPAPAPPPAAAPPAAEAAAPAAPAKAARPPAGAKAPRKAAKPGGSSLERDL